MMQPVMMMQGQPMMMQPVMGQPMMGQPMMGQQRMMGQPYPPVVGQPAYSPAPAPSAPPADDLYPLIRIDLNNFQLWQIISKHLLALWRVFQLGPAHNGVGDRARAPRHAIRRRARR
jgi:hypothetical protein